MQYYISKKFFSFFGVQDNNCGSEVSLTKKRKRKKRANGNHGEITRRYIGKKKYLDMEK